MRLGCLAARVASEAEEVEEVGELDEGAEHDLEEVGGGSHVRMVSDVIVCRLGGGQHPLATLTEASGCQWRCPGALPPSWPHRLRSPGPSTLDGLGDRGEGSHGRSVTTVLIQLVLMSTRAVVSGVVWGQSGPLLSVETSNGTPPVGVVKYGAPESYMQALVLRAGE